MKKGNWYVKAMRYFYNIEGELTPADREEIITFGNNMYMVIVSVLVLSVIASLVLKEDMVAGALLLTLLIISDKQASLIKKLGLHKIKVSQQELPSKQKQMLGRSLIETGLFTLLVSLIFLWFWQKGIPQASGLQEVSEFKVFALVIVIVLAPIYFLLQWFANRKKIVVER